METTILRFCTNILQKVPAPGFKKHWLSCCRCISHTVVGRQEQTRSGVKENIQTDDQFEEALRHDDCFNVKNLVTLKDLMYYNVHLGHHKGCRNNYMIPYLFGNRSEIDILDIEQTLPLFQDALNFAAHIAYRDGIILFVGRSKAMMPYIEKTARECGEYAHCRPWQVGHLTSMSNKLGFQVRMPDLLIFLSTLETSYEQHEGVVDAAKMLIPTIGICDSNSDPRLITYPIPGNDDSFKTIPYYLKLFETAIKIAKKKRNSDFVSKTII